METVLFAREDSIYKKLGADTWDIKRDATKWPGGEPIIAHPPCRAWGNYRHKAKPREGEKELAIWAIEQVNKWGGVVEHPKNSQIWKESELIKPGWILNIDQKWFGHRANKNTNLYIVGLKPKEIPPYPIKLERYETTVERMGRAERERTPEKLAIWLLTLIKEIKKTQKIK